MERNEYWKIIPGYTNYEASTFGNIRNAQTQKVLSPFHVKEGYSQVRLSLGSRTDYKVFRVHRLVALTWIPNPENKETVNHKNANKHDNNVENLEWMSHQEQSLHYAQHLKDIGGARNTGIVHSVQEDLNNEVWKPIPSLEGYQASSKGRIKNPKGTVLIGHHKTTYIQIKARGKKHIYVHRAIAESFCDNFTKECVVNHIDGNKKNNDSSNLECVTQADNVLHAYNINSNKRRVPIKQHTANGELVQEFESMIEASRRTGYTESAIRWAIKHADGRHGGFIWSR